MNFVFRYTNNFLNRLLVSIVRIFLTRTYAAVLCMHKTSNVLLERNTLGSIRRGG